MSIDLISLGIGIWLLLGLVSACIMVWALYETIRAGSWYTGNEQLSPFDWGVIVALVIGIVVAGPLFAVVLLLEWKHQRKPI